MPNWVRNKLKIIGNNYKEIINNITTYKNGSIGLQLDFEKIIPMPECIKNTEASSMSHKCMELFINSIKRTPDFQKYIAVLVANKSKYVSLSKKQQEEIFNHLLDCYERFKTREDVLAYGKQCFDNLINYGVVDWYEWSIKNWGTKWNASETEINDNEIIFETPWDPVPDIIKKLSKDYPNVRFECSYADEQVCVYCGEMAFENGECLNIKRYETGSKEAFEIGFELWPYSKKFYKYDKERGSYRYIQNQEDSGME